MRVSLVTDNRFHEIHRSSYVQSRHKIHHGFIYSSNSRIWFNHFTKCCCPKPGGILPPCPHQQLT